MDLEENTEEETEPKLKLWNPRAAANLSILLTPAFGAWIQEKNWTEIGYPEKAKESKKWFYISIVYLIVVPFIPIPDPFARVAPLALLLVWYLNNGKPQMDYVKSEVSDYEKKSWSKPVTVGVSCAVLYLAIIFGFLTLTAPSVEEIVEKHSKGLVSQVIQQQFKQNITCEKVEIVSTVSEGKFLAHAFLSDQTKRVIKITFDGENLQVEVPAE